MRKLLVLGLAMGLIVVLTAPVAAQSVSNEAPTRFSDLPPDTVTGGSAPNRAPSAPAGALVFYTDRATFQAENPGTVLETFAGTNVPPNGVDACDGPFNSATNNLCFSTGAIVDGLETDNFGAPPDNLNVVLGINFLGNPDVLVGPNTFVADGVIRFPDPTIPVFAAGLDLNCPLGATTVDITIRDTGGVVLGTDSSPCGATGNFWGVASDDQIGSIETVEPQGGGELYANIEFGAGGVPTMGEWGLILLVTLLVGVSTLFVVRRRRA